MLLQNESAGDNVVLLSAPVVTVEVKPEVLFTWPVKLVLVDQLACLDVLQYLEIA